MKGEEKKRQETMKVNRVTKAIIKPIDCLGYTFLGFRVGRRVLKKVLGIFGFYSVGYFEVFPGFGLPDGSSTRDF